MQAAELARALRNLPEDVKKYKTIAAFEEQAKEFLDRCAAGAVPASLQPCDALDQHEPACGRSLHAARGSSCVLGGAGR